MEGRSGAEGVDERQEGKAGVDVDLLGDPTKREAHEELQYGGEDGHGRLRASHEVARDDQHQRGLRDHAGKGPEKSEERLKKHRGEQPGDEGHGEMAESETPERQRVERQAQTLRKL